jgi:hypothetical protein
MEAAEIFTSRDPTSQLISGSTLRPSFFSAGLVAVSLLAAGCSQGEPQRQAVTTPAETSCSVSKLELGPEGFAPYGTAHAGPVWFSAFGDVYPGAPARLAASGPYDGWKVVIHPDPKSSGTANVSGIQCSSGKPVRFCYGGCGWNQRLNAPTKFPVDVGQHLSYTGYMVFPGPGLIRLTVTESTGSAHTVVIEVPSVP